MRISDWMSDVCSTDLQQPHQQGAVLPDAQLWRSLWPAILCRGQDPHLVAAQAAPRPGHYGTQRDQAPAFHRRRGGRFDRTAADRARATGARTGRSEEQTSELQSRMRISYAVFRCETKDAKKRK